MIISRLGIRWGERAEERRKIADREAITVSCAKSDWHRDIAKRITQAFKNMHEKKDSASQKVAVKQILWDTTSCQPKINIQ